MYIYVHVLHAYMYMYACIIISMDCVYTIQCQTMTGMPDRPYCTLFTTNSIINGFSDVTRQAYDDYDRR